MIMNAAFLISRDQETAFDAKVKAIASRFDKLTFKYTGPWPPYNFVNIRLKLERAHRLRLSAAIRVDVHPRLAADRQPPLRARQGRRGGRGRDCRTTRRCASSCSRRRCGSSSARSSDEEFAAIERDVLARDPRDQGRQQGPISMSPDDKITGVDIESFVERKVRNEK